MDILVELEKFLDEQIALIQKELDTNDGKPDEYRPIDLAALNAYKMVKMWAGVKMEEYDKGEVRQYGQ